MMYKYFVFMFLKWTHVMNKKCICLICCVFFLPGCSYFVWIRFDNKTEGEVRVIYNCPADSLITIDIPPRKKRYYSVSFNGPRWSAKQIDTYFSQKMSIEIQTINDTVVYSGKEEILNLLKPKRYWDKDGLIIKIE